MCCYTAILTYLLHGAAFQQKLTGSQPVKKFSNFMEPEGSLPRLQEPTTYPYYEPYQSTPRLPSHILKIQTNIILSSTPGSPQWSLSLRFPQPKPCIHISSPPTRATCPAHHIFLDLITRRIFDVEYRS